jgi:hypothetical protein
MYHFLFGIVHLYGVLNKRRGGKNFGGWVNTCCVPKKTIEERKREQVLVILMFKVSTETISSQSGILYFNGQRGPGNSIGYWDPPPCIELCQGLIQL